MLGYVERRSVEADARTKSVFLTRLGRNMAARVEAALVAYRSSVLRGIPEERLRDGLGVMRAMVVAIEERRS